MCGIVGAVAKRDVAKILLEGLKRLEYRGYDSAGLAVLQPQTYAIQRLRVAGKVAGLAAELKKTTLKGSTGIAHTRWATHGQPTEQNAHPHISKNEISIVHNGIIENHDAIRTKLTAAGYHFLSQTDTEVVAHLIHYYQPQSTGFFNAVQKAVRDLEGAFALGIISSKNPHALYAVRQGPPLVIGLGIDENFIASDTLALLPVTQQFMYLEEGDIAEITIDHISVCDIHGKEFKRTIHTSIADDTRVSKGAFRHFMQKEIFEQNQSLIDTLDGHIINNKILPHSFGHQAENIFQQTKRVLIVACGTSYHAALVARYWIEEIAGLPCQVEIASENRYRKAVVEAGCLMVTLSQSGETADTLAALRQAKKSGYLATLGICNVPESSLVREADLIFLTRAGFEVGVAATKTFTAQLIGLLLLTLALRQIHHQETALPEHYLSALKELPGYAKNILELDSHIKQLSTRFVDKKQALFLARGIYFPIALEGALKLKEISYMHAEAYPAGELKHGPLALVDKDMPVIVIAPRDHLLEKLASNIQEVQARGGELYLLLDETIDWKLSSNTTTIPMPSVPELIAPILYTIPLQLFAYHVAVLKGTDIDQPRNLAKSVTVE